MNIEFTTNLEQKQTLSQTQIQSLKILTMTNTELHQFLQDEQMENPMLEVTESQEQYEEAVFLGNWFEEHDMPMATEGDDDADSAPRYELRQPDAPTLAAHLISQIDPVCFGKPEEKVFRFIIASLNDMGYLTLSAPEIALMTGQSLQMVQQCIDDVRSMEPAGVGADSLSMCLILQVRALGLEEPALTELLKYHLDGIAKGHLSAIAKELGISKQQVKEYVQLIQTLNPRPGSAFASEQTQYLTPDVLVRRHDNGWDIELNDRWMGTVGISSMYRNLSRRVDDAQVKDYLIEKLNRAKLVTKCIEQRRETLLAVTRSIVQGQEDFFLSHGPIRSLTMQQVAEQTGLHESTISRCVKNKYVQCSYGTFPLRKFFTAELANEAQSTGQGLSRDMVKEAIRQLIAAEDPAAPLSDNTLAQMLTEQGMGVSRRTVAKYREELGIRSTLDRHL